MGFFQRIDEALKAFRRKGDYAVSDKYLENTRGEGIENILLYADGFGTTSLSSFNTFHRRYIDKIIANERDKIRTYREMAEMSEISDVIEDAVIEAAQEDDDGYLFNLEILDPDLDNNKNTTKNLFFEFENLFYNKINIKDKINDLFRTYMIDGRLYYERIINKTRPKEGIVDIKKLPTESMDFIYDVRTGKTKVYLQYLNLFSTSIKRPNSLLEAQNDKNIILFEPEQIGYVDYGIYGQTKYDVLGYLEKVKVPYNQLKLLETSVIIYRIIRAPERFVFKIDTGSMPKDKAMKFVEKIKEKFTKKQVFDPSTGRLSNEPEVMNVLDNFFLPQSADGRGSDVTTVGGNASGFAELDDIYYFSRKLYRALKYPISRVTASQEKREAELVFGGQAGGEISRDEVKWSKFLEKQIQNRFCEEFLDLFLLHLELKGMKSEYGLDRTKLRLRMNPPSHYKERMEQHALEIRFDNYLHLASSSEFSKYYLMKKYLRWSDEEISENSQGLKKDVKMGFKEGPLEEMNDEFEESQVE